MVSLSPGINKRRRSTETVLYTSLHRPVCHSSNLSNLSITSKKRFWPTGGRLWKRSGLNNTTQSYVCLIMPICVPSNFATALIKPGTEGVQAHFTFGAMLSLQTKPTHRWQICPQGIHKSNQTNFQETF